MARYEFSSVFADEIRNYISDRAAAGFDGKHTRRSLIGFDRFCSAQGWKSLPSRHPMLPGGLGRGKTNPTLPIIPG